MPKCPYCGQPLDAHHPRCPYHPAALQRLDALVTEGLEYRAINMVPEVRRERLTREQLDRLHEIDMIIDWSDWQELAQRAIEEDRQHGE